MTGGTLFSGFGGCCIGMQAAGIDMLWGIELDDEIASVARMNGLPVETADVTKIDPADYPAVDALHMSPPCPSFSVAKTNGIETETDRELARACVRFVEHLRPKIVTLENVWGYRGSQSWAMIYSALLRLGYGVGCERLNSASYGVPQTRERMIVWAVKGTAGMYSIPAPTPTHSQNPVEPGLFGEAFPQWVGWYEAIEDLIPDLPESRLAPWQLARLPEELRTLLIMTGNTSDGQAAPGVGICYSDEPTNSVYAQPAGGMPRAVLIDGQQRTTGYQTNREDREPAYTLLASHARRPISSPRALLISGDSIEGEGPAMRKSGSPSVTTKTGGDRVRAVLVTQDYDAPNRKHDRQAQMREGSDPAASVRASESNGLYVRALLGTRVVQMTPRCLARFQSFPDSYVLPEKRSLACKGIGNACPPLLMQRLYEHLLRYCR